MGAPFLSYRMLVLLAVFLVLPVAAEAKTFRVLYINSYERGYRWSDDIEDSLRAGLESAISKLELSVEYLDSRRFDQPNREQHWALAMNRKYAGYPLDLIITSDNAALDFALARRAELFANAPPIVFCGYNFFRPQRIEGQHGVTGVNEEVALAGTIDLALPLHPATRVLAFVVSTGDPSSRKILENAEASVFPRYREKYEVVLLKDLSLAEIQNRLHQLPKSSLLFIAGQTSDRSDGRALTPVENSRLIATLSPLPTYGFWEFNLGTGVVGGQIITGKEQGAAAAEMAIRILRGTPPDAIPPQMDTPTRAVFDFPAMQRFGIEEHDLPAGSRVLNRPQTLWGRYRWWVSGALLVFLLQTALAVALIKAGRQRHKALASLQEAKQTLEARVEERTAALRQSNLRLAEAQAIAHIGHWEWDIATGSLAWSEETCRIFGVTPGVFEPSYAAFLQAVHADDREYLVLQIDHALRGGGVYDVEHRIVLPDGAVKHVRERGVVSFGDNRQPERMVGTVQDISDQARADADLRKLSRAVEQSHNTIVITDSQANIEFVNPAFTRATGYTLAEALGQNPRLLKSGLQDAAFYNALWHTLRQQRVWQGELCNKRKDGSLYWEFATISPIKDSSGNTTHYVAVKEDITERKRAEAALRQSETRLREITDTLAEGVYVIDLAGRISFINHEACRILGGKADRLLGQNAHLLFHHSKADGTPFQEAECPILNLAVLGQVYRNTDECFYRLDGAALPVAVSASPIWRGGEVLGAVVAFHDMTQLKQAQAALLQAKEQADAANRAKSAFLANMSHELRTPLNVIMGFAQILAHDETLTPAQTHKIEDILRGGEYLLGLINDILDLAKIEAGRFEILSEAFDLADALNDIQAMFQIRASERKLAFHYLLDGTLPRLAEGDGKRLRQILINLLGNAMKFTEQGAVTLRAAFHGGLLQLEIEDSGIGIAPEEQIKVFDPFSQVGENRYKLQGSGLGLAITHKLIENMRGSISLSSELGKGSVFRVTLPLRALESTAEVNASQPRRIIGYRRLPRAEIVEEDGSKRENGALRVLITDDIASNRAVLKGILRPLGFALKEAASGEECLEIAPAWLPDVVLMDLRMPGLDGHETTRELRKQARFATTPIIIISASAFAEDRVASLQAGCAAHIGKPVKKDKLLEVLQAHLPLQWQYQEAAPPPAPVSSMPLSQEQAGELLNLLRSGNISNIIHSLEDLSRQPDCPSKVAELLVLAREFEIEKLRKALAVG
jgi:PAS domain S-box-containing protein